MVPGQQDTSRRPKDIPGFYFERVKDRTNIDDVSGYLTGATLEADWRDVHGRPADPPSMEEAMALVNTTIENMYKTAASPQAFLINLAAISGGGMLLSSTMRICRLGNEDGSAKYRCDWEYGFGSIRGQYTMEQQVPLAMLRGGSSGDDEAGPETVDGEQDQLSTGEWQTKYHHLLEDMQKKDRELLDLRTRVMNSLKGGKFKE